MDEEERASGLVDHRADLLAGLVEGGDGADDGEAAVAGDLGRDPADAADVGFAVLLGEGQAGREVAAHDVTVEGGDGAGALLEDAVHQRLGERGLATAGEAGEEEDEPLLLGTGLVGPDDGRDVVGVRSVVRLGEGEHVGVTGVRARHLGAELVVDGRIAPARQRNGDDCRVLEVRCGSESGANERDGRQVGGPGADQGQEQHRPGRRQLLNLLLGERVDDRNDSATGVLLSHLLGAEVVAAEGAVLRVSQRLHRTTRDRDAGQRQALGVDQLDATGVLGRLVDIVRQRQSDRAARLVEGRYRAQGASRQQLEVVELAGGRAVLRVTHRSILTDSVEFQRHRGRPLRCDA